MKNVLWIHPSIYMYTLIQGAPGCQWTLRTDLSLCVCVYNVLYTIHLVLLPGSVISSISLRFWMNYLHRADRLRSLAAAAHTPRKLVAKWVRRASLYTIDWQQVSTYVYTFKIGCRHMRLYVIYNIHVHTVLLVHVCKRCANGASRLWYWQV